MGISVIKKVRRLEIPTLLFLQACCVPVSWQQSYGPGAAVPGQHSCLPLLNSSGLVLGFAHFGPGLLGALAQGVEPVSLTQGIFRPGQQGRENAFSVS